MNACVRVACAAVALLLCAPAAHTAAPEWLVVFRTSDGVRLNGTQYGSGGSGVVLSHMLRRSQRDWAPFARRLAAGGYMALTFDFRGHGKSGGARDVSSIDRDVRAAAAYVRGQGARRLVLIGASMGGTASLEVATTERVDALAVISSPSSMSRALEVTRLELATLSMPSLWITSAGDGQTTEAMRRMYDAIRGPKTLHVYPGAAHGTALFATTHGADLTKRLLAFLKQYAPSR